MAHGASQASRSCSCWPTPQPQQRQIQAAPVTYTTATVHGNTGSWTHQASLGIKPASSWILVRFVSTEQWQELLKDNFNAPRFLHLPLHRKPLKSFTRNVCSCFLAGIVMFSYMVVVVGFFPPEKRICVLPLQSSSSELCKRLPCVLGSSVSSSNKT